MKKFLIDFRIIKNERLSDMYSLFALEPTNGALLLWADAPTILNGY